MTEKEPWERVVPYLLDGEKSLKQLSEALISVHWPDLEALRNHHYFFYHEQGGKAFLSLSEAGREYAGQNKIAPIRLKKGNPEQYFDGNTFVAETLANELMQDFIFKTHAGLLYSFDGGVYVPSEDLVKYEITRHLGEKRTTRRSSEVIDYIKSMTWHNGGEDLPINLINVRNGLIDIDKLKLRPHNYNYFTLAQVPVIYDKDSSCPKFMGFLDALVSGDDIPVVQEWFGYCLYRGYPIQKALILLGPGANGKSTLLEVLRSFLGTSNVSNVPLQALSERFASVNLHGKLLNYYADLSSKAFYDTGCFKILTGGDALQAERKFREPFTFRNYAKLVFSCNKLPESRGDDTDAFFRRWGFLNFPNTFEWQRADKNILKKITTQEELSGILSWALEGLKRLFSSWEFSRSASTDELRLYYERISSPIKAFVQDMVDFDPEKHETKTDIWNMFVEYCRESRLPIISRDSFFKALSKEGQLSTERLGPRTNRAWCIVGLNLKKKCVQRVQPFSNFKLTSGSSKTKIKKRLDTMDTEGGNK